MVDHIRQIVDLVANNILYNNIHPSFVPVMLYHNDIVLRMDDNVIRRMPSAAFISIIIRIYSTSLDLTDIIGY